MMALLSERFTKSGGVVASPRVEHKKPEINRPFDGFVFAMIVVAVMWIAAIAVGLWLGIFSWSMFKIG